MQSLILILSVARKIYFALVAENVSCVNILIFHQKEKYKCGKKSHKS